MGWGGGGEGTNAPMWSQSQLYSKGMAEYNNDDFRNAYDLGPVDEQLVYCSCANAQ